MSKRNGLPTLEELNKLFYYDPEDGLLYRKSTGAEAGHIHSLGYRVLKINSKMFYAHRVVWKILFNTEPQVIDHINRIKTDNRIENLREVTQRENCHNGERFKGGAHFFKRTGKWTSKAWLNGKETRLGYFETEHEAKEAYKFAISKV